ncbi:MAG: lytic transglycosylase domain-containing protein [Pseudomonadota bacterium]
MVLVMENDGSLRPSQGQESFARNYNDGIGQGSAATDLIIFGEGAADGAEVRIAAVAPRASAPRPEILAAIEDTALRYASHPGLRAADITVIDWLHLYRANIEIESAYNPTAVSSAGAIGLGQLMPATATDLGVDPNDWRQNLGGSARYLAMMLGEFGDVGLALAAYNAGPDAVRRYDGIPPFPETQNHVRRVLAVFNRLEGATP